MTRVKARKLRDHYMREARDALVRWRATGDPIFRDVAVILIRTARVLHHRVMRRQ